MRASTLNIQGKNRALAAPARVRAGAAGNRCPYRDHGCFVRTPGLVHGNGVPVAFAVVVALILLFSTVIGPGVLSLWREIGLQTCGLPLETIWYNRFRVQNLSLWIEARKRFHLSHAQIQMARELGMNPKKFGKLANHRQEPWKQPLPQFIEHIYFKHFGKACPDRVLSLEDWTRQEGAKKQEKKQRRQKRREQAHLEAEAVAPAVHAELINTQIAESGPGSTATSAMPEMPSSTHPSSCAMPS